MDVALKNRSEREAQGAERLTAFGGLNLLHLKRQVAELLSLIGGNGIFDEYTKHDISHIDSMLQLLDSTIIPATTLKSMSTADWLMLVLSVYFHDLGMLVTKSEYQRRNDTQFPAFRDTVLFSNDNAGKDYQARLVALGEEENRERFLYQEFVRAHHAERIRYWIEGTAPTQFGFTTQTATVLDELLRCLPTEFRQDLAMICESHHLDDLNNLSKYKTSQPYGMAAAEVVNLQYIAVLLRSADLLHITSDRTPSILFKTLIPSDPLSQREWAKQRAVRSIRVRRVRNEDGIIDPQTQSDTFEVHASFTDEEGFFGLTSYLDYAEKELLQSFKWIAQSQKTEGFPHEFPWRHIDQRHIETHNFLREQFEFTLDQEKILDLLTGHTLYNETGVVLRELVQNSIDAVRLQFFDATRERSRRQGKVSIHWDSATRALTVADNGTGMSQDIIQNNLLKVGASRYQEPRFRERYPAFSPISRFGIGILSAFMIADDVEIITVHEEEEKARRLLLRSVHGKYLIRLLDKAAPEVLQIGSHGTLIRLRIRPSATMGDVLGTARAWIVIPECNVTARIDDGPEHVIGFGSTKDALEDALVRRGLIPADRGEATSVRIRIDEWASGDLSVAYALVWSEYFKEWSFLPPYCRVEDRESRDYPVGTCLEGIRVEYASPGFQDQNCYAIANATGTSAPRTNVARSGLESTLETRQLIRQIYGALCGHISKELEEMQQRRGFSLTRAAAEAQYLRAAFLWTNETS